MLGEVGDVMLGGSDQRLVIHALGRYMSHNKADYSGLGGIPESNLSPILK